MDGGSPEWSAVAPPLGGGYQPHQASDFTFDLVVGLLAKSGAMSQEGAQTALLQERAQRKRLLERVASSDRDRRHYKVSPIELLASFHLKDARNTLVSLDEDRITQLVGESLGIRTVKIDPLKLDSALITSAISWKYARTHSCLPLREEEGVLLLGVTNPWDRETLENLSRSIRKKIEPVLCSKADIQSAINNVHGFSRSLNAAVDESEPNVKDVSNLEQLIQLKGHGELEATDKPIVNAVEYIFHYALEQRVSDIHIEPKRDHTVVRMRIDGMLHDIYTVPRSVHAAMTSRVKLLARLDVAERRRPQDGRIKTKHATGEVEFRVSTVPVAFGEKTVIRIFDPNTLTQDVAGLGFYKEEQLRFESWITRPNGLILVTGPTGSGKTTTLYSALAAVAKPDVNVVSIEDPVEIIHERFNQISIQPAIELGFAQALRHVLRQDPDVIMVGEIRDPETAQYAVQAAMTGHLVFSTLHTNDAASAVTRMADLGVQPFLLSNTLVGCMAQRLVRRVCQHCAEDVTLTRDELAALGVEHPEDHEGQVGARRGKGCPKCRQTGYYGRGAIFELLDITSRVKQGIIEGYDAEQIYEIGCEDGMHSLREHAMRKLADGVTSFEEILRVTAEKR